MRHILVMTGAATLVLLSACASTSDGYSTTNSSNRYASACERDYARNKTAATAAGVVIGAVAGAAIAKDDTKGAIIGGIAGGLIGNAVATKDDPCGYGFTGYPSSRDYGYWDERLGRWVYG